MCPGFLSFDSPFLTSSFHFDETFTVGKYLFVVPIMYTCIALENVTGVHHPSSGHRDLHNMITEKEDRKDFNN